MTFQYFTVNDATYGYTVHGEGEPLLLFHGFTGTSGTWESFISEFSSHFQVITVDLPGHGNTVCKQARTMKTFSNDIAQMLNHLGLDKVHLLGYSMGGRTALSFAMYYPEMVQSLILESSSPGLKTEKERQERAENDEKLAQMLEEKGVEAFVDYWEDIPLFDTQKKLPKQVRETIRSERLLHTAQGLADSLRFMGTGRQPSWWKNLDTLTCPVLLIVGEIDEKFVAINRSMDEIIPNSSLKIVKNAGHAIHVEQPEKFVTIVMEFMTCNEG